MQMQIRSRGITLSEEAKRRIERRMRLALARYDGAPGPVSRVRVAVADGVGPGAADDVRCSVLVSMGPVAVIQIDERDRDLEAAVARAAERAGRAVERRLA